MIKVWSDPMSGTLHIKIEITEVFAMRNVFILQDFEKALWNQYLPLSERLEALAKFVRRTEERR